MFTGAVAARERDVRLQEQVMNLILWRHAEAHDGADDAARALTAKGLKQAGRIAAWLHARLPEGARVLVSPAVRAQQTASALQRRFETDAAIAPGAHASAVLEAAGWPNAVGAVVVVGHQPSLGSAAALALTGQTTQWRLKKAAFWWICTRPGQSVPAVVAVISPELL